MAVQETSVAIGWPLGLGLDTTGWPLGLRLRLVQEDLQWPRELYLDSTATYSSGSSSDLETMSSKSTFFNDKTVSLGALIGISADAQRTISTERFTSLRSQYAQSQRGQHSVRDQSCSSAPTGWKWLSLLSCRSVSANDDADGLEIEEEGQPSTLTRHEHDERPESLMSSSKSPSGKLYDNVMFQDNQGSPGSTLSELNPLFVASEEVADEAEDEDEDMLNSSDGATLKSLLRSGSKYSIVSDSQSKEWVRGVQTKDSGKASCGSEDKNLIYSKSSALREALSRIICCHIKETMEGEIVHPCSE